MVEVVITNYSVKSDAVGLGEIPLFFIKILLLTICPIKTDVFNFCFSGAVEML